MSDTETTRAASWEWPAALLVALLAIALYLPSLRNGYVFDDGVIVRDNPIVKELRYGQAVTRPYWPAPEGVDRGGGGPLLAHATNALLYGLVVLALFPLARRLAGRGWPALTACILFAIHPAHTEAVAPIVGRTDLLAALGALVALQCFVHYRAGSPRWWWLALGALAYAVGLGGKESAAPVLLLAVAAAYGAARVAVLGGAAFRHADAVGYTLPGRLLFAAHNAVVSLDLLVAPTRFHHMVTTLPENAPFTYPDPTGALAVAYAVGGLVLGLGWLGLVRRAPRAAFLWFAAVVSWLPTSGLVPAAAGASLRFLFLPSAFFCCGLALGLAQVARLGPRFKPALAAVVAIVALAGAVQTVLRTLQWRSDGTFYAAVLAEVPDCYTAHYSLGTWYATRRPPELDLAREHFREAIRITDDTPYSFEPRLNLAISYEMGTSGRRYGPGAQLDEAARLYRELIAFAPQRWEPHLNLALILDHQGRTRDAIEQYERALELNPDHPQRAEIEQRLADLRGQ
jgi:tetratricopeptide (TPR) repeat protein